ncbi:MAG TPA: hypothetical protein VFZ21_26025 [Gemmatimonadaceae bacterium]|nr:hypothetical protein [Gemmatimonadaceae bacterium]
MSDKGAQTRDDFLIEVERRCSVNIDVHDESGQTVVYRYTERDQRIAFEFFSMTPSLSDVNRVAMAISELVEVANSGVGIVSVS